MIHASKKEKKKILLILNRSAYEIAVKFLLIVTQCSNSRCLLDDLLINAFCASLVPKESENKMFFSRYSMEINKFVVWQIEEGNIMQLLLPFHQESVRVSTSIARQYQQNHK